MLPRLPVLSALREQMGPQGLLRAFSTTPAVRDDASSPASPSPAPQRRSSTSSLLSLNRPSRRLPRDNDNSESSSKSRSSDAASRILGRYKQQGRADSLALQSTQEKLREQKIANDYLRQMPRRWTPGDVYSPHDLSPESMRKFRRREYRKFDAIDALGVRPQDMYKNFTIIREFTNSMGQILPRRQTGLRPVNQRKVAKMVRRAIGMGIYPSVHDHPEVLRARFFPHSGGSNR